MEKKKKPHHVDDILLDYYMRKAGYTVETTSKMLGITSVSYRNKRRGSTEFTVQEMYQLIEEFKIPDNGDRDRIFNPQ